MARILDLLVDSTMTRIKAATFKPSPPPKQTPDIRALHREYVQAKRTMEHSRTMLEERGFTVGYAGKLSPMSGRNAKAERVFNAQQEGRRADVRKLRDAALIDLIGLPPLALKAYYVKLKARLAKI